MNDNVQHPKHYADSCSLECIQVMVLIFGKEITSHGCLFVAFKYSWRFRFKNGEEDIRKARWYLDYMKPWVDEGILSIATNDIYERMDEMVTELEDNNL